MKLLLDESLSYRAAALLRDSGADAVHVFDLGCKAAADPVIVQRAQDEGRVIITFDADFHAWLSASGARIPSVVRLRFDIPDYRDQARIIEQVVQQYRDELNHGCVISVRPQHIRLRQLPLP